MTSHSNVISDTAPLLSVIIPVLNEELNVSLLATDLQAALAAVRHEIIFVDDASTDHTPTILGALASAQANIRGYQHKQRCGQSAAIRTGILQAKGLIIATLDGDGQNPPREIPRLLEKLNASPANVKLIQGQRERRRDTLSKKLASKFANSIRQYFLKDGVRDSGCGLKVFYKDAYLALAYFDHLHRFMPAMMRREGFDVQTISVSHSERGGGVSKYGNLNRALVGIFDLMGVLWLSKRRNLSAVHQIGEIPLEIPLEISLEIPREPVDTAYQITDRYQTQ